MRFQELGRPLGMAASWAIFFFKIGNLHMEGGIINKACAPGRASLAERERRKEQSGQAAARAGSFAYR